MESADGIFSAAGGGLAVLLAFVIFAVFDSYSNARSAAGQEAVASQQMYSTAGFFPDKADQLRGETVCYARAVIHQEWPAMQHSRRRARWSRTGSTGWTRPSSKPRSSGTAREPPWSTGWR